MKQTNQNTHHLLLHKKVLLLAILLEFLLIAAYLVFSHIRFDPYHQCYQISSFNGFTYEVYDDYAVVCDYSKNISHVTVPDTFLGKPVTTIGSKAFLYLPLKSVTLGKNIDHIEDDAFCSCTNLQKVDGTSSLKVIGNGAFMNCTNLESLSIGSSLISIGKDAFWNCNKLKGTETSFPGVQDGITNIDPTAFDFAGNWDTDSEVTIHE